METNSIKGFKRTIYCGQVRPGDIGREVTVCGWVQRARNLGGLIFIDLRDRTGIVQCVFDGAEDAELSKLASGVRSEWVLAVAGNVRARGEGAVNPNMSTGQVEVLAVRLRVLSRSETPPFEITDKTDVGENLRLKYRYLDLRRPALQKTLALRHRALQATRAYFDSQGFYEIETPIMTKSTPEGARDYLVPSRLHEGKFYALPQSPQQYKQLLMLSGFDRYMQIARCFRDEDLRADRQPEFTQVDLEMSFVDVDDVLAVGEGYVKSLWKSVLGIEVETPILRIPYAQALERFGSDKPDMRFDFELINITDIAEKSGFKVFSEAVAGGGSVRVINVQGHAADFTRKDIDALTEFIKGYRAKGLAWLKLAGGEMSSSFAKFLTKEELDAVLARAQAKDGDILFIVADADNTRALQSLGALRVECARRLGLMKPDEFKFLWVTEFPMFEWSEEEQRLVAAHHPFTSPMDEDIALLDTDPARCRSKAYDLVINGYEVLSGSIRIFDSALQSRMFALLGHTPEDAQERFGQLLTAFQYGVPPHGGMGFGFDRLVMLLAGTDNIRDVIAFPKLQNASEPMMASPAQVEEKQLRDLHIKLDLSQPKSAE